MISQTIQELSRGQTNKQTNKQTDTNENKAIRYRRAVAGGSH